MLDIRNTKITSLPTGLKVGTWLDISFTKITSLPSDLKVKREIYVSDQVITRGDLKFKIRDIFY